jgi:two-component system copper resistance phosphate regulon response regulator CusR
MRILVAEDSEKLQRAVALRLRRAGYVVDATGDGAEAWWLAEANDYDGVVLDLMLPGLDGLQILKRLRESGSGIPVLILTAKNAIEDRVAGLDSGSDDYLTKPFAMEELVARVGALVRRKYGRSHAVIQVGDLVVDTQARRASRRGRILALRPREYRLLELLASRPGEVVSNSEIETHLYHEGAELVSNTIAAAVSTLRRELDQAGEPPLLHTRRGLGYVLAEGER